uniref:Cytochrome b-c1 complex subunit 8 n=1 Tax=Prolemur simus TaxID=1328070 RepID=A0A8C9AP80_PROSS
QGQRFYNITLEPFLMFNHYYCQVSLSSFLLHTFLRYFSHTQASFLNMVPTFVVFYLVYTWESQEFEKSKRKNPATQENDK